MPEATQRASGAAAVATAYQPSWIDSSRHHGYNFLLPWLRFPAAVATTPLLQTLRFPNRRLHLRFDSARDLAAASTAAGLSAHRQWQCLDLLRRRVRAWHQPVRLRVQVPVTSTCQRAIGCVLGGWLCFGRLDAFWAVGLGGYVIWLKSRWVKATCRQMVGWFVDWMRVKRREGAPSLPPRAQAPAYHSGGAVRVEEEWRTFAWELRSGGGGAR